MFPDYRTSAAQRRNKLVPVLVVFGAAGYAAIILGIGYVVAHFVAKFW